MFEWRTLVRTAGFLVLVLALSTLAFGPGCKKKEDDTTGPGDGDKTAEFGDLQKFNPDEWTTNKDFPLVGDPKAKKGGTHQEPMISYLSTLRMEGPNSNITTNADIGSMTYESLLDIDPNTMEFIPCLATHWQISEDKKTFRFRIDERARWADGSEVTADDVLWSWWHRVQEDRKEPVLLKIWGKYEKPVVEDKYTIRVRAKELNWRHFLTFSGMAIYPAKLVRIAGEKYLKEYQWKLMMGSGPYEIKEEDIKKEVSLTLTRRKDYWAEKDRRNIGRYNFDKIKFIVVRDRELIWEKFKKGDLDLFFVGRAQRWFKECDFDKIKMGWIKKRKIFNQAPIGFSGFCFNMRKPPFDDKRVRKAFCHLVNRERLMKTLFFNEYVYTDSIYPGSIWANPSNPKIRYNPELAAKLLTEAGWKERDSEGWLVKDGKIFELTLEYGSAAWTRVYSPLKESIEEAGIKFNLKVVDWRATLKKKEEHKFTIVWQGWRSGLFPVPEYMWKSDLADKKSNNNVPGFKNKRVDELCTQYNTAFEVKDRVKILREVDSLVFNDYCYAYSWYSGNSRPLYWDKFGFPKEYFPRTSHPTYSIWNYWWFEPEKIKALEEAMKNNKKLPLGEVVHKPWEGYEIPEKKK